MKVPFLDLKTQYHVIKGEVAQAFEQVMENTAFASGPFVEKFENNFAAFCQTDHAIGVGSGTDALWLALLALGVGHGDEVITVPNTFIATAEAITYSGATPVFIDVDETTYTMNPDLIEAAITPRTKAIIPVHLFGQTADMDRILAIAKTHNLYVIEDACQAHGAQYKGRPAGSMGDAGCFSFYPGKNLGAFGDAGAVVTNDPDMAKKIRQLRDHGQSQKYYHDVVGWNARMDGLQGAVLDIKLQRLPRWNEARRENAALYQQFLQDSTELILPQTAGTNAHVFHIFAVRVEHRDAILKELAERDVYCGIHYPVPLHLQKAYSDLGYAAGSFPVSEKCASQYLSLPMFPELSREQIEYAVDNVKDVLARHQYARAS